MKNIKLFIAQVLGVVTALALFTACENDDHVPEFTLKAASEDVAFQNEFLADYLLSDETPDNIAERFVWNEVDFGVPTEVSYQLEGSISESFDADGAYQFDSGTLTTLNASVTVGQLLTMAEGLGLDDDPATTDDQGNPNNTGTVYFKVTAFAGSGEGVDAVTTESQVAALTITLLEATQEGFVCDFDQLWVVGAGATDAGWGWDSPVALTCLGNDVYGGNIYLQNLDGADNNFRFFTAEGDWGSGQNYPYYNDAGYSFDDNLVNAEDDDSNFAFIGESGFYYLEVDTSTMSITISEPIVTGNCENNQLWVVGAGAVDAGWGWDSPVQIMCSGEGVYSGYINLQNLDGADNNFRFFTVEGNWGSGQNYPYFVDAGYSIDDRLVNAEDDDSNFAFTGTTGRYFVTIDTVNLTIDLQ